MPTSTWIAAWTSSTPPRRRRVACEIDASTGRFQSPVRRPRAVEASTAEALRRARALRCSDGLQPPERPMRSQRPTVRDLWRTARARRRSLSRPEAVGVVTRGPPPLAPSHSKPPGCPGVGTQIPICGLPPARRTTRPWIREWPSSLSARSPRRAHLHNHDPALSLTRQSHAIARLSRRPAGWPRAPYLHRDLVSRRHHSSTCSPRHLPRINSGSSTAPATRLFLQIAQRHLPRRPPIRSKLAIGRPSSSRIATSEPGSVKRVPASR